MERQEKFIVIKMDDYEKYLDQDDKNNLIGMLVKINDGRFDDDKDYHEYVVVQDNWPMYGQVWKMIEDWVEHQELKEKYSELIMAVATKFPDESRHETALKYILECERDVEFPYGACEEPL